MNRPRKTFDAREIEYSEEDWKRLERFREETKKILKALKKYEIEGLAHGSVARGDVREKSDIDIIIPQSISSFRAELALEEVGYRNPQRKIVMATPWQLPKGHIILKENRMVTIPLEKPKRLEEDFYRFGGAVTLKQIKESKRVPGVDKRLILIEPTEEGHRETQVVGREEEVAKIIEVSIEIVEERIQVLTKREKVGKTGIFLERKLRPNENFESVWNGIKKKNPEISKRQQN